MGEGKAEDGSQACLPLPRPPYRWLFRPRAAMKDEWSAGPANQEFSSRPDKERTSKAGIYLFGMTCPKSSKDGPLVPVYRYLCGTLVSRTYVSKERRFQAELAPPGSTDRPRGQSHIDFLRYLASLIFRKRRHSAKRGSRRRPLGWSPLHSGSVGAKLLF